MRELDLDGVPDGQRNWLNDHTVYTHGYGVVAAYGNREDADGKPVFFEQNIPSAGTLGEFEPRIYFGEQSPDYSIVGAPREPRRASSTTRTAAAAGQANTTYAGEGGVPIEPLPLKLAYAIKYREMNFLLSDAVNADSPLLDHRTPRDRVQRVAPWLTLDGNAYPAVVDGRVQWIVDGYTTSADYPNSQPAPTIDRRPPTRSPTTPHLGAGGRRRPGQLHPQLGQGHGRRLRRHRDALRVGRPGPDAQGVDAGVPRHRPADVARSAAA